MYINVDLLIKSKIMFCIFLFVEREGGGGCATFQNQCRNPAKTRVTALLFGIVVAFMMFIN